MSYEAELNFAQDLAQEAGAIMTHYFRADDIGTELKADNTPLTVADSAINDLVIQKVKDAYPDYGVLGEETSSEPERQSIWVVDPIDGTVPYSIGIPVSTFSLALVDRSDGQPLVAVTHDPFLQETFTAVKNGGSYLNGQSISTSSDYDFSRAYLALSSRSARGEGYDYSPARSMEYFRDKGSKILSFVSFVYTGNRVASGQLLATVIGTTNAWDIAACALLVEEAGGIVTDFYGKKRRFDEAGDGCVMAANQAVLEEFLEQVRTGP